MTHLTRREFGLTTIAAIAGGAGTLLRGQTPQLGERSLIHGVQFGLQPFCYHDLAMTPENRPVLFDRLVQDGMGVVELHATWVEPRFTAPGVSAEQAREKLRDWRLHAPEDHYTKIRKDAADLGISIFTYYINFDETFPDDEVHAVFRGAKLLGAQGCIGSYGLAEAQRLVSVPSRHGMFLGLHNHDNLSDPDAFNTEASFVKGLAFSPDFKATLDTRHFTAADQDCIGFLERHHERVSSVHLGDRRRHNGRSTPFGEGDAPIIEILRMIRDNQWPIVALLEFEHGTLRPAVQEVQLMFDYCKRAVA